MHKPSGSCRLVYVGDDGDLYQAGLERSPKRLTWGWAADHRGRLYYVWPSYSPDGASRGTLKGSRKNCSPSGPEPVLRTAGWQLQ